MFLKFRIMKECTTLLFNGDNLKNGPGLFTPDIYLFVIYLFILDDRTLYCVSIFLTELFNLKYSVCVYLP